MTMNARLSGASDLIDKLDRMSSDKGSVSGVRVGIVESAKYPIDVMKGRQTRSSSPTVAQVAFWNEFGTRGGGWGGPIPERPFMRNSIERYKSDEAVSLLLSELGKNPQSIASEKSAELLGIVLSGIMKDEIVNGEFVANAPATVYIKTRARWKRKKEVPEGIPQTQEATAATQSAVQQLRPDIPHAGAAAIGSLLRSIIENERQAAIKHNSPGKTTPLIDTGLLLRSINYQVIK